MTSILQYVRYATCASCDKRTGDPGNREPAEIFGARVPIVQHKKDPADEDKRRNLDEERVRPGRLKEGEERVAPEIQGRDRQCADHRHAEGGRGPAGLRSLRLVSMITFS